MTVLVIEQSREKVRLLSCSALFSMSSSSLSITETVWPSKNCLAIFVADLNEVAGMMTSLSAVFPIS